VVPELRIERSGDGVALRLPPPEQAVVRGLAIELTALLEGAPEDPSLRRLAPPAYDDADDERAYREIMGGELRNGRLEALALVAQTAEHERLDPEEAETWLRALNDLRLVLGTRLNVQEDVLLDDPSSPDVAIYAYLSWLQEQLVEALLPD
jgi:hypothetical protein